MTGSFFFVETKRKNVSRINNTLSHIITVSLLPKMGKIVVEYKKYKKYRKEADVMFNKLYDNCFKTELGTVVTKVKEDKGMFWHAFKETIFYKESGGMRSDIGMIDNHMVKDLKWEDGELWHLLDAKLEGNVFMSVNLHERFRKCQIHTAQHLISAVLSSVYKVKTLSHHVSDDDNDIEFDLKEFNEKMAFELEVLCNGLIRDDLDVTVQYPNYSEAAQYVSKEDLLPHIDEDIRVVRIGALDYNLCGCMHVPSLRYLQMLFVVGFEKTTRGFKIHYTVGDQMLDSVKRRYKVLDEVSNSLAVSHLYVNTGINRIVNEVKQLNRDLVVWKQKYYKMLAKELAANEEKVILHYFDDIDQKSLANVAQYVTKEDKKAVIFVAKIYDNVQVVVASHPEVAFDTEKVFKQIAEEFHLKGGGSKDLQQGGGLYKERILPYIKEMEF